MGREWRWPAIAIVALLAGAFGAQPYVQLLAPYYRSAAVWLAKGRPWTITRVDVAEDAARPGVFVRLHGEINAQPVPARTTTLVAQPTASVVQPTTSVARPAASVIGRVQAGAAIEGPLLFWTLLLAWPAALRRRAVLLLMGIPIFLGLEAATTVCQLLSGFAEASAVLAGDFDPLTGWERWSRFLESGGRDVLAVCAALLTIAGARRLAPNAGVRSAPWTTPAVHRPILEPVRRSS
jgi:hypothetical protein